MTANLSMLNFTFHQPTLPSKLETAPTLTDRKLNVLFQPDTFHTLTLVLLLIIYVSQMCHKDKHHLFSSAFPFLK